MRKTVGELRRAEGYKGQGKGELKKVTLTAQRKWKREKRRKSSRKFLNTFSGTGTAGGNTRTAVVIRGGGEA